MFYLQHFHQPLSGFCEVLIRLQNTPSLPLGNPPHCRLQLPSDHQSMVGLSDVLLGILLAVGSEVLHSSPRHLLQKHLVTPVLPHIDYLLDPPSYCVGYGGMLGLFQYHRLEDDKLLQVPLSIPHPMQLVVQGHNEVNWNSIYNNHNNERHTVRKIFSSNKYHQIFSELSYRQSNVKDTKT